MSAPRIAAICALALCALVPSGAAAGDPPTWARPVQLGKELPSSWFPDIQADAAGGVRIVYSASLIEGDANEIDGLHGAVVISELEDDGWTQPVDIAVMDGGIASRPMIASDGQYAHMIYRTAPPGVPVRVVYTRAPLTSDLSDTRSWSQPFNLSNDEAYWAQIGLLPAGGLVVVYNRITETLVNGKTARRTGIFARYSGDQGSSWGDETRIAETVERVARISLAVSPGSEHVIVVWDEGYDNLTAQGEPIAIASAVSDDGGRTWGDHQRFRERMEQTTVATDGASTVLLYRSVNDSALLYRTSDDGGRTWSLEKPIPEAFARPYSSPHNFDKLSAAFDGDGGLHFTWVGPNEKAPNGLSVMLATLVDGVWTSPQILASPTGFPEYPRLAVSLGNRFELVYFVRDKEFDVGAYTMWTMSGESDAQAVRPLAFQPVYAATVVVPTPAPVTINVNPEVPPVTSPASDIRGWDATPQATLTSPIVPILGVTMIGLLVAAAVRLLVVFLRDSGI